MRRIIGDAVRAVAVYLAWVLGGGGGRRLGGTTGVAAIWLIYFASYES